MPKDPNKKRYEVHFLPDIARKIEGLAENDRRSVKNFLEGIILDYLNKTKKTTKK